MDRKRFLGLDGLRGVCALTILFFHCADFFHKGPIFLHGFLAVDMFFILSGFVIALTYEEKLKTGIRPKEFLFSRARPNAEVISLLKAQRVATALVA